MLYFINFYNSHINECAVLLSTLVGAIIGTERELRGKSAGIRTYSIVAMAACLFTILSRFAGGYHDTTRIAAQVVVGIGFIGAGVIWHKDSAVEGLTTAASLWGVAAIGMGIGYGLIALSLSSSVIVLVIMEVFGYFIKCLKKAIGRNRIRRLEENE